MDPTDLSDAQLDQLAQRLAPHLPSGTHGDRVVLSRRAFAAAVGGTLGASGLVALGVDPAAAQAAGQVGTSSDPVDAFTYDLVVQNALQSDLDAGGNKLTNVGSLSTESVATGLGQLDTKTVSVGTSSTDILTNGTFSASYFAIVGDLDDGSVDRWTDVILAVAGGSVSTLSSVSRSGSPTRSYSVNDRNVALSLSDGPIDVEIQWWQF